MARKAKSSSVTLRPNEELRQAREIKGWSQRKVAEELGTNENMVSRWECGESKPSPFYREKLCILFEKSALELGFIEQQASSQLFYSGLQELGNQEMNRSRRRFLESIGAVGTALAAQELLTPTPWERLSTALAKPSGIDAITLNYLEVITKSYWQLRTGISSRELLNGVVGHLQTLTQLLQHPLSEGNREHLCSLAGEVTQIAGQISFDMNDYSSALSYYKVSLEAAQEANNHALHAVALGRMSFLPVYSGHAREALALLQKAHRLAKANATPPSRSWLAVVEAEALANMQDEFGCLKALEYAEHAADQAASEEDPYWTGFDHSRFAGYTGVCYLRLQKPDSALTALRAALTHLKPEANRRRSTILTDLATAYVQQGEVEQGCELASQALSITKQTRSAMVLQRLQDFRYQLKPWENLQVVRDLDEQLLPM